MDPVAKPQKEAQKEPHPTGSQKVKKRDTSFSKLLRRGNGTNWKRMINDRLNWLGITWHYASLSFKKMSISNAFEARKDRRVNALPRLRSRRYDYDCQLGALERRHDYDYELGALERRRPGSDRFRLSFANLLLLLESFS